MCRAGRILTLDGHKEAEEGNCVECRGRVEWIEAGGDEERKGNGGWETERMYTKKEMERGEDTITHK